MTELNLTIVTPVRNARDTVLQAISSLGDVSSQVEHLIYDACSDDGTSEILAGLSNVTVIREPDTGSHAAMNKGLLRARGEVIGFLNADDRYSPDVLPRVLKFFGTHPEIDMVVGGYRIIEVGPSGDETEIVQRYHHRNNGQDPWELVLGAPGFNARFFRRSVFARVGGFNEDLTISGDRDFLIRCALAGLRANHIGVITYTYRAHEASRTLNRSWNTSVAIAHEHMELVRRFFEAGLCEPEWRMAMKRLYGYECAKLAVDALRRGRLITVARQMVVGFQEQPAWMMHAIRARRQRRLVLRGSRPGD